MVSMTLYSVLGVSENATQEEIKKAYRKKSRFLHPDVTQDADSTDLFQMVQNAYDILSHESKREEYDRELRAENEPAPAPEEDVEPTWGEEETWDDEEDNDSNPDWGEENDDWGEEDEEFWDDEPVEEEETFTPEPDMNGVPPTMRIGRPNWSRNVPFETARYSPSVDSTNVLKTAYISLGVAVLISLGLFSAFAFTDSQLWATVAIGVCVTLLCLPATVKLIPFPDKVRFSGQGILASHILTILGTIVAALFLALGIGVPMFAETPGATTGGGFAGALFVLLALAAGTAYVTSRIARKRKSGDRMVANASISQMDTFGRAGQLADAIDKFGRENIEKGILGEKTTAKMFNVFPTYIPGAKVFHGLRFPTARGDSPADVDHAVLVGRRLALVDSKMWKEAHYAWDQDGDIQEQYPDGSTRYRQTNFPAAVAGYAKKFPHLEVFGWILVHPANGRPERLSTDNTYARNTYIMPAEQTIETIGDWLLEGKKPDTVNRGTLMRIFANMK